VLALSLFFGYIDYYSLLRLLLSACVTIFNLFLIPFHLFNKIRIWFNRKRATGEQKRLVTIQASYLEEMLWHSYQGFTCLSHASFFSETEKRAWRLRINMNAVRHAMHDITTPLTAKMIVRLRWKGPLSSFLVSWKRSETKNRNSC